MKLALSGLPEFRALPGAPGPQHRATIHIRTDIDYLERAWDDDKYGRPSERPLLELTIPTLRDGYAEHLLDLERRFGLTGGGITSAPDYNAAREILKGWNPSHETSRPGKAAPSALFLAFVLRDPRLHQLLHKSGRRRLVHREADGAFGCVEALEFVLERLYHR